MTSTRYLSRIKILVGALIVAIALTAAVLIVTMGQTRATSYVDNQVSLAPMTKKAYLPLVIGPPDSIYGVEMSAVSESGGLDLIQAASNAWVHIAGIDWQSVEPTESTRNWSAMAFHEQNFLTAQASNMIAVVLVRGTPPWAQLYPPWSCGPILPSKLAAFGNFMYDLVQRYSVPPYNVKYWELMNEPDVDHISVSPNSLLGCWGDKDDYYFGGGYYAEMLKVVYPRIKQANPNAQVLVGGLLLDCDPRLPDNPLYGCHKANPGGVDPWRPPRFLEGILRGDNGNGANYFDGISFHSYEWYSRVGVIGAYSNTNWLAASNTTGPTILAKTGFIKSVLQQYGVTGKYLVNTEIALLCQKCTTDMTDPLRINFEKTKAYVVAQAYPQSIISGMRAAMWFRTMDLGSSGFFFSSLLNDDLTPRPAYTAFLTSRLFIGSSTYERPLTTADYGNVADVRGYSFIRRDGKRIWILWSIHNTAKLLVLPATPSSAYNYMGRPMAIAPNHQLQLAAPDSLFTYVLWDQ